MKNAQWSLEVSTKLPSSAVHVLLYVAAAIENGHGRRFPDTKLAETLGKNRETIARARQQIVEAGFASVDSSHHWELLVLENPTMHDHHDHHRFGSSEESDDCPKKHQADLASAGGPVETVAEPEPNESENAVEKLVLRCVKEAGLKESVARWLCQRFPSLVEHSLYWLPKWKEFRDDVINWPGWFYRCVINGGLGAPTQAMIEYRKAVKEQRVSRGPISEAVAPPAVREARRPPAPEEPTRQQRERAAEQAQREAEEAIVRQQFEVVWPTLSEGDRSKARKAARRLLPDFMAGKLDESDEIFQALLRAQTIELFGQAKDPGQEGGVAGLPWKTARPLKGVRQVFSAVGEALAPPSGCPSLS